MPERRINNTLTGASPSYKPTAEQLRLRANVKQESGGVELMRLARGLDRFNPKLERALDNAMSRQDSLDYDKGAEAASIADLDGALQATYELTDQAVADGTMFRSDNPREIRGYEERIGGRWADAYNLELEEALEAASNPDADPGVAAQAILDIKRRYLVGTEEAPALIPEQNLYARAAFDNAAERMDHAFATNAARKRAQRRSSQMDMELSMSMQTVAKQFASGENLEEARKGMAEEFGRLNATRGATEARAFMVENVIAPAVKSRIAAHDYTGADLMLLEFMTMDVAEGGIKLPTKALQSQFDQLDTMIGNAQEAYEKQAGGERARFRQNLQMDASDSVDTLLATYPDGLVPAEELAEARKALFDKDPVAARDFDELMKSGLAQIHDGPSDNPEKLATFSNMLDTGSTPEELEEYGKLAGLHPLTIQKAVERSRANWSQVKPLLELGQDTIHSMVETKKLADLGSEFQGDYRGLDKDALEAEAMDVLEDWLHKTVSSHMKDGGDRDAEQGRLGQVLGEKLDKKIRELLPSLAEGQIMDLREARDAAAADDVENRVEEQQTLAERFGRYSNLDHDDAFGGLDGSGKSVGWIDQKAEAFVAGAKGVFTKLGHILYGIESTELLNNPDIDPSEYPITTPIFTAEERETHWNNGNPDAHFLAVADSLDPEDRYSVLDFYNAQKRAPRRGKTKKPNEKN